MSRHLAVLFENKAYGISNGNENISLVAAYDRDAIRMPRRADGADFEISGGPVKQGNMIRPVIRIGKSNTDKRRAVFFSSGNERASRADRIASLYACRAFVLPKQLVVIGVRFFSDRYALCGNYVPEHRIFQRFIRDQCKIVGA